MTNGGGTTNDTKHTKGKSKATEIQIRLTTEIIERDPWLGSAGPLGRKTGVN